MKKLHRILLVDDNEATNFLHRLLFEELNLAEGIDVALNGKEAIDHIESSNIEDLPELILLDINMPYMDGFEFLECYKKVSEERKSGVVLMMLSTSIKPEDRNRAGKHDELKGFLNKPLTEKKIIEIWNKHFKD